MATTDKYTEQVRVLVTEDQSDTIKAAAELEGLSVSAFVRTKMLPICERVISKHGD